MDSVGERLRWTRQRHVWSQADLSKVSGVPVVTISRIENNRNGLPKPSTARKLSRALGIDPAWLLYGEDGLDSDDFQVERRDSSEKGNITRLESA
jgi:transcriptional regulator with XRE-family HTH domain